NRIQFDIEVHLESLGGYKELGAVHYRGDYDLTRHGQGSTKDLSVTTKDGHRVLPHVLELTFGVDRNLWALADAHLLHDGDRSVWKLPPYLAPVAVGVFPLLRKEHTAYARALTAELARDGISVEFDDAGTIGKRYARMDEAGTPYCVTIDGGTVALDGPEQATVTVRLRDTKAQERVARNG
ncbi:glycyl-tRNA synthetase, partial [mine drainage metagenome]